MHFTSVRWLHVLGFKLVKFKCKQCYTWWSQTEYVDGIRNAKVGENGGSKDVVKVQEGRWNSQWIRVRTPGVFNTVALVLKFAKNNMSVPHTVQKVLLRSTKLVAEHKLECGHRQTVVENARARLRQSRQQLALCIEVERQSKNHRVCTQAAWTITAQTNAEKMEGGPTFGCEKCKEDHKWNYADGNGCGEA